MDTGQLEERFKTLFRENFGSMCIFAERYLGDMEQARDVVHDAFALLWLHPVEIADVTNIRNYTYGIVRNQCLDMLRRRSLHSRYVDRNSLEQRAGDAFFEAEMTREEVYAMLDKAISNHSIYFRQNIELHVDFSRFKNIPLVSIYPCLIIRHRIVEPSSARVELMKRSCLARASSWEQLRAVSSSLRFA